MLREERSGKEGMGQALPEEKIAVVSLRKTWPGLSLKGGKKWEIWEHQGLSGELCRISFSNIKFFIILLRPKSTDNSHHLN